jgi:hypothetical protein
MKFLIMLVSLASHYFLSLRSKYFNLRSSPNMRDQVSHPYTTRSKIRVSRVSMFKL